MATKWLCGACHKRFATENDLRKHIMAKQHVGNVRIYKSVGKVEAAKQPEYDDESFADRAVAAEIAMACGEPTDDEWLLGIG